jgi:hypothetical protein
MASLSLTPELSRKIAEAAIREHIARQALAESAGKGQRDQARLDRTTLATAQRALAALIAEAEEVAS